MAMPNATAPTSRNQSKIAYEISNYAEKEKLVNVTLSICMRDIDGKKELVGTCDSYDYKPNGERIIPKEYTSRAAFKKYVGEMIESIYDQLEK